MRVRWMSQAGTGALRALQWCLRVSTTDYCPNWNSYLRSLYRPVGWLPVAAGISGLLAIVVAPSLWMIAGGLLGLWLLGLLWPLVGMIGVSAVWIGRKPMMVEGEPIRICLRVRNRCPLPLFGLSAVTQEQADSNTDDPPPLALSRVGVWSQADFELNWRVPAIGYVPNKQPYLECGFPFDIYRRRKRIPVQQSTLVVPWSIDLRLTKQVATSGGLLGYGETSPQPGREGELTGLRPWLEGDSWRRIHWSQSARQGKWIVKQGGLPISPTVRLSFVARDPRSMTLSQVNLRVLRRWLASVGRTLLSQGIQVAVFHNNDWVLLGNTSQSMNQLLELIATSEFRQLIASSSWIGQQPLSDQMWSFSLTSDAACSALSFEEKNGSRVLPAKWRQVAAREFRSIESELDWCEREFVEFWQVCLGQENRHATA